MPAAPVPLSQISLRQRDRAFCVGGSGYGKSALADLLGADFVQRYAGRDARRLILDSKPRYRAQWEVGGRSAAHRYRHWDHGRVIKNSVVVDTPNDLKLAWSTGYRTAIVQGQGARDIPRLVYAASLFLEDSRAKRPQLLHVNETLDFFHGNGAPRGSNDVLIRAPRAGRERGTASLYEAQRTRGIPASIMEEMNRCYRFALDYEADAKRLGEFGMPPHAPPIHDPEQSREFEFCYWTKLAPRRVFGPYRLALPAWAA